MRLLTSSPVRFSLLLAWLLACLLLAPSSAAPPSSASRPTGALTAVNTPSPAATRDGELLDTVVRHRRAVADSISAEIEGSLRDVQAHGS